jgi:hypothetical protein
MSIRFAIYRSLENIDDEKHLSVYGEESITCDELLPRQKYVYAIQGG